MAVSIIGTALLVILFCSAGTAQNVFLLEGQPAGVVNTSIDCQGEVSITSNGGFPYGIEFVNKISGHYQLNLMQSIKRPDCNKGNATCTHKSTQVWTLTYNCDKQPNNIEVRIKPKNFCPPFFCNKSCGIQSFYEVTVNENTQIGTKIFEMKICDDDSELELNPYDIQIDSQVVSSTFNTTVYNLNLNQSLDYDDTMTHKENITLHLISRNNDTADTTVLLIKIEDFDDLNPAFTENVYACGIYEGVYNTSTQCLVEAYDQDMGIKATIEYMIHSVYPKEAAGMFSMSKNGNLTIKGTLDRETVSNYFITIKAFQENRPDDRFNFTTLVLTVLDKDDNPPVIHSSANTTSIMENANNGTIVFQLSVTDRDKNDTSEFHITDTSDAFHIDSKTGTVTVLHSNILDREQKVMFPLQVRAVSHNGTKTSLPLNLTVVLLDENDNSPIFDSNTNTTIQKTKSVNSTVLQVNATDEDDGLNGRVQYSLQTTGVPFAINSETGQIYVSESMNETFEAVYTILVQAEDQALQKTNRRFTSKTVTINVNDVNIHAPMFRGIRGNVSLSEAADIGSLISYLNATDQDPADTLRFNITEGNINGDFIINEHNYLSTKHRLDRETTSSYKLVIEVTDSIHTVRETINITVTDENDNDPVFTNITYMFEIKEETFGNFTVEATDDDIAENSRVEYSIDENSSWKLNFTIGKSTGVLSTKGKLDKEALPAKENVTFTVYATDNGSPKRTGKTQVSVNVKDINDNGPMFPQHNTTLTLVELTQPRIVYTAQAVDKDATQENRGIVYTLKSEQSHSPFVMNRNGSLSINKQLKLHVIDDSKVVLQIQASNSSHQPSGNLYDTQTLTITIQDVNDHSANFVNKSYTFNINETTPEGTHIGMASATDGDVTPVYNTVYYWTEKTASDIIRIDTFTGSIYLVKEYDCDTLSCDKPLELKIFSSDMQPSGNGKNINNSVQVYINVLPVNEYSPIFSTDQYECIVRDNYTGTFNCLVNATDEDSGKDGKIKYTITNHTTTTKTNLQPFAISSSTGELTLTKALSTDDHRKTEYVLGISAEDTGYSPRKSFASVNIIVDGPPTIVSSNTIDIYESDHHGKFIGYVHVLNPEHSTLQYSITNTTLEGLRIDAHGYLVYIRQSYDYEKKTNYTFVVEVNDTNHNIKKEYTINILPVNDNSPTFPKNYSFIIQEDSNVTIEDVQANDNDNGIGGDITKYSIIISNEWSKNITINETFGQIIIQPMDRETLGSDSITFTVTAEDSGSPSLTGVTSVTIQITGINDNAPYFLPEEEHVFKTVEENKAYPNFFTSKAYDKDIGNDSNIYYRVVNKSSAITIDNNGTMSLNPLKIDSSNNGELEVTIEAYNEEAYSNTNLRNATQILTLTIKDVNDEVPTFTQTIYNTTVSECCATGTSLLKVTATDKDPTREFNTVTYWMEGENNSSFIIDSRTGEIKLLKALDYDAPINDSKFEFKVYATDLEDWNIRSNHTNYTNVTITVTGCNDNTPKFSKDVYNCSIEEGKIAGFGCRVTATDIDNDIVSYAFVDTTQNHFKINNATGEVTCLDKLDFEDRTTAKVFLVDVSASDKKYSSVALLEIHLLNVNDEKPVFNKANYTFNVDENVKTDYMVGSIDVHDPDGDVVQLHIDPTKYKDFYINSLRDIFSNTSFDYETKPVYKVSVEAKDGNHTVKTDVTVNILDRNDNAPMFGNDSYIVYINESTPMNTVVVNVAATDNDGSSTNNVITYKILSGNTNGSFLLNSTTGAITAKTQFNCSVTQIYTLVVQATDNGDPKLSDVSVVTINIQDENNNPPYFVDTPYSAQVAENEMDKKILQIHAVDLDPSTKALHYKVINNTHFYFTNNNLFANNTDAECCGAVQGKHEQIIKLNISILVSDEQFNETTYVAVNISDVNDNTPYFVNENFNLSINDTSKVGFYVTTIQANDIDISNDGFTYILHGSNGDFQINDTTGEIIVHKEKDRKWNKAYLYTMDVTVYDSGSPPKSNKTRLNVTIIETNKNAPKFLNTPLELLFSENNPNVSANITATDDDSHNISYRIIPYGDLSCIHAFKINPTCGTLTLANDSITLDYESLSKIDCIVVATDNAEFPKSSSTTVTINVEDVDEPPKLRIDPNIVYKAINATKGSIVAKVKVDDPDKSEKFRNFSYSIKKDSDNDKFFEIDNNGTISTKDVLAVAGTFNVSITVTDGGGKTDTGKLTVIVSEVRGCTQEGSVFENATINTMISGLENFTDTCFNQSDIDRSMINFTIRHSSGYFGISNRSLVTLKTLDREQENEYIVVIAGNDKKTGILKTQIQAVIKITDINDCKPVFNKSSYAMSIKETQNETAWVGRVTASDEDEKPTLHYEVDKESNRTGFTIDDDGNIYTKPIDYDGNDKHIYNLTVICSDTIHSATTIVLITIEDVNDNPPKFTNDSYSFKVNESIATGVMPNVKVKANDPDTADEGKLEYTIVQGDIRNNFDIDNTGQFSLIKSLDYENMTDTNINLVVNVRDTDNHTTNVNVTLRVLDVNDNAPKFTKPEYTFKITEGINLTTNNFSVSVVDNDAGNNSQVTFSLQNGTDSAFSISTDDNNKQGFIHINKPLDRENASLHLSASGDAVYSFTVVAIDHGEPKLSSSVLVSIHVSDINDCTPKFENDNYTVSILEGSRVGSNIVTITATDCDYKPNITYSLTGDANNTFNITQNGKLILNKVISMKDKGLYQLQIVAHDGSNAGKVNLTIKITDTNDHSPTFTQPIYTFNVSETNNNVTIGDVLAKDEDPDENGNVAYSITSGNTNTTFTIVKDTNGTGTIRTLKSLDREQKSEYVLIITAKDNAEKGRQRQGTCTVSVVLLDVNDNYPVFNQPSSAYNGSVKENADNGTNVNMLTKIRSTDSDKDINGTKGIIYTLYDSAGSGSTEMPFCIDKKTGIVYVCGNVDREAKSAYSLSINATDSDGKGLTTTANLTIYVVDINDEAPQFLATPYRFSILENVTTATSVGQIKVEDMDINGLQNIKFQIIHGDDEKFYIDNNGTIRVSGKLDRESKPMYTLTVQANDGRNTNKLNVTVILLDINDNTPLFNESSIEINVVENSSPGFIYNVSAYDKDKANSNNSEIEFSLNETSDVFSITKEGFISTTRSLDREKSPSYFLTVVAKDHGSPPLSSSIPVHVHILDLNDNYPVFYHHGQRNVSVIRSFTVEKSPVNSVIALPVANDTDFKKNGTITYSIEPVNKYFRIDANTGLVQLNKSIEINTLVQENTNITRKSDSVELNITIVATDGGGKNTTLLLIVTVEEINDNAPVFQNSFFKFNVDENLNDTFVGNCVATIPNATFTHMSYRLLPDESNFLININNGTIKTKTPLDREELSHYTLAVQVKDGRTPERTAFAAIEITVNDANDNAPLFLNGNMVLNIEENTNWTRQTYVTAADKDVGNNALIVYTLDSDFENRFKINQSSGLLKVHGTFDREQDAEYVLHVLAKDSGTPSLNTTTTVTINVLDENDNPPVFYDVINNVTVKENATGTVFTVHANDSDSGLNGSVVYNLVNAEEETFEINQLSGTVSISGKLDFEKRRNHILGIEACDQGIKPKCAYRNVSVHIVDVFDFVPKFEKQVYETTLNWTVPVATEVIKVNAGSGGNVKYTLAGDDSVYFTINVTSGQITTAQELNRHTKDYVFTVNAIDESSRGHKQSATSKVIVHISDHAVVFPENEYQAVLPENMNTQSLLIDLNTTDEINGLTVLYSILKISPNVSEPDVFRISETDGKVYCEKPLDREAHSQYTIYISATSVVSTLVRNKRDIHIDRSASTIKLIINVTDVNDSPPTFPVSQQKVFGVPSDARANYIVARLKATDADSGDNAKTFYRLLSHDNMTKFSIDPSSGDVKTNVAMASLRRTNFTFTVIAEDAADGNQSTTIDIKIVVIPRNARLQLQTNISFAEFRRRQHEIIEELNNLLGVDVQLENLVPHLEGTSIMLTRTDMTFHGINRTTGNVVPYNEMMRLIQNTSEKVNKLLGNTVSWSVTVVSKPTNVDPSAITTSQIVLICMAIFIFFGSLVAILIAQYSWTRYDQDTDQREKLMQEYQFEDIELDSMKSRRSSKMSSMNKAGAAAINPAFLDTEFKGTLSNGMKNKPVYESQELRMNFDEEPISDNLPIALGPSEINATISIDDSGVENTSDHSSDRYKSSVADKDSPRENRASNNLLIAGEGPVMTSSPRVSHEGALVFDAEMIRPGPSNEILNKNDKDPASRINLRIDIGETETDDELDSENDEMNPLPICSETEQQNVDKKDNKLNGVTKVKKTVDFVETVEEISNEEDEVTSF